MPHQYTTEIIARFYSKVSTVPTAEGCLDWQDGLGSRGYGRFWIGKEAIQAHRVAWEIVNGPIPDGLCACHRCDRKSCVNHLHIFIGSYADNNRDRKNKGRNGDHSGEKSGLAKLTEAQVREIRSPQYATLTHVEIAKHFGVGRALVGLILHRKVWAHLDDSGDLPVLDVPNRGAAHRLAKLTEAQVVEIRGGAFNGWSQSAIAEHFGVSRGAIGHVLRNERWAHLPESAAESREYRPIAGEKIGTSKLTAAAVLEIRSGEKFPGWTRKEIAEHFGVSLSAVMCALSRKTWTHI